MEMLAGAKVQHENPSDCSAGPPTRKKFGLSAPSHSNLMVFYRSLGGTLRCGACCAAECAMHSGMWKFLRLFEKIKKKGGCHRPLLIPQTEKRRTSNPQVAANSLLLLPLTPFCFYTIVGSDEGVLCPYLFALVAGVRNNKKKGRKKEGGQAAGWKCLQGQKYNTETPSDCSAAPPTRKKSGLSSLSLQLNGLYRSLEHFAVVLAVRRNRHVQRNVEIFTFIVSRGPFKTGEGARRITPLASGDCVFRKN
ncbi:hypothetical protein CEXT_694811 [Caerostris extrusa]|uniref:Uncharacterized protein n=1 Tax=Caerostris extrusa TaxID=172846 RepID=A0AAV4QFG8_CAEEX|nr:hypothetical protein CEXT_694811 [Caerostris extrusa]